MNNYYSRCVHTSHLNFHQCRKTGNGICVTYLIIFNFLNRQQRPARRSLYEALRKEKNVKCLILTGLIYGCIVAIAWCRVTRVTKVDIDFTAFPITRLAFTFHLTCLTKAIRFSDLIWLLAWHDTTTRSGLK